MRNQVAWIDLQSPCDVFFFEALMAGIKDFDFLLSTRAYAETIGLTKRLGLDAEPIGYQGWGRSRKMFDSALRVVSLSLRLHHFDVALCFGDLAALAAAKIRNKNAINYMDNNLGLANPRTITERMIVRLEMSLSSKIICPRAMPVDEFRASGYDLDRIMQYEGYKENVYVARYSPDEEFLKELPFGEFVVVRPEALTAAYVQEKQSIVPELLKNLEKENINVVFLPRSDIEKEYAKGSNPFIPERTLNGLDLAWFSRAVLTGSGTFAREAACLGNNAISFFPETKLLAVDQNLIDEGRILHSRDPHEIVDFILSHPRKSSKEFIENSKSVLDEVTRITKSAILEMLQD